MPSRCPFLFVILAALLPATVWTGGDPASAAQSSRVDWHREPLRPRIHFTPPRNFMNDPNGLVFDVSEHGWATEKTGTVKAEAEAKAKAAAEKVTA